MPKFDMSHFGLGKKPWSVAAALDPKKWHALYKMRYADIFLTSALILPLTKQRTDQTTIFYAIKKTCRPKFLFSKSFMWLMVS